MSIKIVDMRTEYCVAPLALPNATPRFSWRYETEGAYVQESYRILVSSAPNAANADLWDSGVVFTRSNVGVEYAGKPLNSRMRCYWKVIVDEKYESDVACFETGLLKQSDWHGTWISAQLTAVGGAIFFRRDFYVPENKTVSAARAYVCGLGCHEFYCNGKKIGDDLIAPSVSEYTKRIYYCVYPFEKSLHAGKNSLGVLLGHGWYGGRKLLVQVHIDYTDGTQEEFYTANCADWWVTRTPIVSDSFYDGETYDARRTSVEALCVPDVLCGWADGWLYGMLCEKPCGKLVPQMLEGIRVVKEFSPISKTRVDGMDVYDFGQNFSGFAKIRVKGERGAKVVVRYGEQLEDGRVNQLNLRTAEARDEYILSGNGEETYCPRFTYHGFQYAEVETVGNAEVLEIKGQFVRNSVENIGDFAANDRVLDILHKNIVMTEGSNLHGIMSDCPQRDERFGWLNDLSSRVYQSINNYNLSSFIPKVVADITDTQDEMGRIADTAPFFTGFRPADPVVVSYLLLALKAYRRYGDTAVLKENYPYFCKWVAFLTSRVEEDGATLYCCFADWCPPEGFDGVEDPASRLTPGAFVSILYYYLHLKFLSEIAEIIGETADAKKYADMAKNTKNAILRKYKDKENGKFKVQSQAAKAFLLGMNFAEDPEAYAAELNADLEKNGYHAITGNLSYVYLFNGLTENGYGETVYKILTNPEYPGWGYMVANGATTVWERWEKKMQQKMHSFCHPMFGSYDAWLYGYVAGIQEAPDACGMDKIRIKPYFLKALTDVSASVNTVNGKVSVRWQRLDDTVSVDISVPPNVDAEIEMEGIVGINGKACKQDSYVLQGGGQIRLTVKAAY